MAQKILQELKVYYYLKKFALKEGKDGYRSIVNLKHSTFTLIYTGLRKRYRMRL